MVTDPSLTNLFAHTCHPSRLFLTYVALPSQKRLYVYVQPRYSNVFHSLWEHCRENMALSSKFRG